MLLWFLCGLKLLGNFLLYVINLNFHIRKGYYFLVQNILFTNKRHILLLSDVQLVVFVENSLCCEVIRRLQALNVHFFFTLGVIFYFLFSCV